MFEEIMKKMGFGWKLLSDKSVYTFTMHPPCHVYSCSNCPYLDYPFCTYKESKK